MTTGENRFLALGDSYTIGEGVPDAARWPAQLVARMGANGIALADAQIIARTGWTTGELAAAMDVARFESPYALVTLLIGVNNQYRGYPLEAYRAQFRALLTRAIALAGSESRRVLVISIPDWSATPFAKNSGRDPQQIAAQIDGFNAAAREESISHDVRFVDVTGISRDPLLRDLLVADGLHPSAAQYARWVDAIAPAVMEILAR